jgi:hypothetical protein
MAGALVACGPSGSTGIQTEFADSAGVIIAESSGFPEPGAGGWALDSIPVLSIGALEGDAPYQFFQITGSMRLSDGRIAITDYGTHELRLFSPDGVFQTSFGREGEGPGEFSHIRLMGTVGSDTMVVIDGRQRRVSRIHPETGFLGLALFPEEAGITMHFNGMFGDGSIVFGGGVNAIPSGDEQPSGYERLTNDYYSISLDGETVTPFGEFPGTEVYWTTGYYQGESMLSAAWPHFGKSPRATARGDRMVLGTRDFYELNVFDPTGALVRIIRIQTPLVPVTQEHLDALLEERLARLPDPDLAPRLRSGFRDTPTAENLPAFESLLLDSHGHLWVEDFHLPGDPMRRWTVFDEEGVPRTRLSLPASNRVHEIGEDYVLAGFQDELGVEYLRMYSLRRGE